MPHFSPPQFLPSSPGKLARRGWSAILQRREARQLSGRLRSAKVRSRARVCRGAGLGSPLWKGAGLGSPLDITDLLSLLASLVSEAWIGCFSDTASSPLSTTSTTSSLVSWPGELERESWPGEFERKPAAVGLLMFRERRRVRSTY